MSEYLYVLSNPAMPGLLKVGRTTRLPEDRAAELYAHSGVPAPFVVEFFVTVNDCEYAERDVHAVLVKKRLSFEREFFSCTLGEAKDAIEVALRVDKVRAAEGAKFADWLMARTDLHELPTIISWLEGTKAKDVIAALRRQAA